MDRLPILRRCPKRIVWCLYCACAMLGLSAFYIYYSSTSKPTGHNFYTNNLEPFIEKLKNTNTESGLDTSSDKSDSSAVISEENANIKSFGPNKVKSVSDKSYKIGTSKVPPVQVVFTDSKLEWTNKSDIALKNFKKKLKLEANPKRKVVETKYIYLTSAQESTTTSTTTVPSTNFQCNQTTKTILLWTSFFDYWDYFPQERFDNCQTCRNCHITRDRSRLNQSDVVIFHCRDMSLTDLPLHRTLQQRWAFFCLESPPYSDFSGLQYMNNMFNLTLTYRRDSDVITQYGSITRLRPPRTVDFLSLRNSFMSKSRTVAWLSSHCPTYGGRDAYVAQLRKYVDVDVYGACGEHVCPMGHTDDCMKDFAKRYKFFLAFENTICQDYVTEKFYRALNFDMIPVVFGGAKYRDISPPTSYIDALSFKSPKHLAYFLNGVGSDFQVYSKYFRWRRDYSVKLANSKECDLCDIVNRSERKFSYADMRKWWVRDSKCRSWG